MPWLLLCFINCDFKLFALGIVVGQPDDVWTDLSSAATRQSFRRKRGIVVGDGNGLVFIGICIRLKNQDSPFALFVLGNDIVGIGN